MHHIILMVAILMAMDKVSFDDLLFRYNFNSKILTSILTTINI